MSRARRARRRNADVVFDVGAVLAAVGVGFLVWRYSMPSTTGPAPGAPPVPAGKWWCTQFPTSRSTDDLAQPFRGNVVALIAATRSAGGQVSIAATARPRKRAWLMHYAWMVSRLGLDPAAVPVHPEINITWTKTGADEMVRGYGLAYKPALDSHHIPAQDGVGALAVDMQVVFPVTATVIDAFGAPHAITAGNADKNPAYWAVAATYGVHKLASDEPHYSIDGH